MDVTRAMAALGDARGARDTRLRTVGEAPRVGRSRRQAQQEERIGIAIARVTRVPSGSDRCIQL